MWFILLPFLLLSMPLLYNLYLLCIKLGQLNLVYCLNHFISILFFITVIYIIIFSQLLHLSLETAFNINFYHLIFILIILIFFIIQLFFFFRLIFVFKVIFVAILILFFPKNLNFSSALKVQNVLHDNYLRRLNNSHHNYFFLLDLTKKKDQYIN